jgi:small-conductance mechanosensitive channel
MALMDWMIPSALVACGALLGLVSERYVFPRLERVAVARRWVGGDFFIASLRGVTLAWFLIAGTYLALLTIPLHPAARNVAHKVLLVVLIASVTIAVARITGELVSNYSLSLRRRGTTSLPSPSILLNLTRLLVLTLGGLVVLQSLGIAITPLLTALGVGGLAVALALQETLSNLFSGIYIIVSRQFKPGEYIKLNTGEEGYVVDINWRSTKIREGPNNMIIVPNAKLAAANVTNYYQPNTEVAVSVQVSVGYESDLDRVEQVALEVARRVMRETHGGIPEFEPLLFYHTFGGESINFNVILRAREVGEQSRVKHEFVKWLHERFRREGIAFRSRPEVLLRDANQSPDPLRRAWRS